MKLMFLFFTMLILIGCTDNSQTNNPDPNKERIIAKNKQTAMLNEVTNITQIAQKLEKEGRGMELYRNSAKPESQRECRVVMAEEQKQVQDLTERISKLPESYNLILTPITGDLNDCVGCAKKATESCVKARAAINLAIKKLYP